MSDDKWFYFVFVVLIVGFQIVRNMKSLIVSVFEWLSSENWQTTIGSVISSEVETVYMPRYKRGRRLSSDKVMFKPVIAYEYHVNAQTFQSTKIYIGQNSSLSDSDAANLVVSSYPVGKTTVVYFHPNKPERSFLERKLPRSFVGSILINLFWLSAMLVLFYFFSQ